MQSRMTALDVHDSTLLFACMVFCDETRASLAAQAARDEFIRNSENGAFYSELHISLSKQFTAAHKEGMLAGHVLVAWIALARAAQTNSNLFVGKNRAVDIAISKLHVSKRKAEEAFKKYQNAAHIYAAFGALKNKNGNLLLPNDVSIIADSIRRSAVELSLDISDWNPVDLMPDPSNDDGLLSQAIETATQNNERLVFEAYYPHLTESGIETALTYTTEKRTRKERTKRRIKTKRRQKERMDRRLELLSAHKKN